MPDKWVSFLIVQEEQEADLLNQDEGVDSAQPFREAKGDHFDLKSQDYQKALR